MKFKSFLTICLACASFGAVAQTHLEGAEYFKADQFENAKDLLLRSLDNVATDKAVSNYYLGLIAADENKSAEAARYFDAGIAANPEYPFNYIGKGRLALLAKDVKSAENDFKTAEKYAKKDPAVAIAIARAYAAADPVAYEKQITKNVDKARKQNIEHPDIYLFEGDQLKATKDWGGAAAKYEMAKNYNNKATEAYVKYANLFTQVNPDFAIRMLRELLDVNPNSALGQRELANAFYNKKDYANAAAQYGKYVQNPAHFKSDENRYAFLLFYGGDFKKGYDYATKLLMEDPFNFTAQRYQFMNAAQIKEMQDQLLPLAENLYATHKKDPKNNKFAAIDFNLIANELQTAGRPDEAIEVLNEGVKEMPEYADFNKSIAMVYLDKNNLTKTAEYYSKYLSKIEPGYNDYIQQATFDFYAAIENKNNPELAKKFFDDTKLNADKAKAILPDNYKPVKIYGDIAKQTAANEKEAEKVAAPYYTESVALLEASADPSKYARDAKEMYMYLGNYYYDAKDIANAKANYEKYMIYDPNNEGMRKFIDGIK